MAADNVNDYDAIAPGYADKVASNAWNAYYERPTVLRLAGGVNGQRVLDAGCGPGEHAAALVDRGATVTGIDSSAGLLAIAAEKLKERATFMQADLRDPLPFEDTSFDCVIASLVMHYLRDWEPTLREFHRVLAANGRLVISTHHPFMDHAFANGENYFATYQFDDEWEVGEYLAPMRFWHRPLSDMTRSLTEAGFALNRIEEPEPDPIVREIDPKAWQVLTTRPDFIFFAAARV